MLIYNTRANNFDIGSNRLVKNVFLTFFISLQRKRSFRCAPSIKNLTARWMPVHPCTGHKLTKNRVFHHPAKEPLKIDRDELFALFNRRAIQRGAADSAKEDFVAKV
ncbi:MAG: hypothetical protein O7H40_01730, partial [Gammaproteobacteria bacterium]|nr:hypothetical protein [Gammaproteobacteria bacterium]